MADKTQATEGTKSSCPQGRGLQHDPGDSPLETGRPTVPSSEKRKSSDQPTQPAKVQKFSISLGSKPANRQTDDKELSNHNLKKAKAAPIKMSLSTQPKEPVPVIPKTRKVASVFNEDESDEEEEMPPEAKMRMKNVGRETPTSTGPNSFGKGRFGFCDRNSLFQKELKKKMEDVCDD
ncbi:PEST proteolytic signal-containing nuclear protein-like [Crassostrea virginica]